MDEWQKSALRSGDNMEDAILYFALFIFAALVIGAIIVYV